MNETKRPLSWWYWYATALLLSAWLLGWKAGAPLALALAGWQIVHYSWRLDSLSAPVVQLRIAHFATLALGAFWPVLIWAHFACAWAAVLFPPRRALRWQPA
ncbi:MAG: hypothetical protein ACYTHK_14030 [Planctomycetota bacterium]|jgi:hypothetical protein